MDEYLDVVMKENLEEQFSQYLEVNDNNLLNLRNMPWLDLGELPVSYNTHKSEAFQVYITPSDELPFNMVVEYNNWDGKFNVNKARKSYAQTQLEAKEITYEDILDTLMRGGALM